MSRPVKYSFYRVFFAGCPVPLAVALMLGLLIALQTGPAEARRYASIVIDASNGRVLHAENPDRKAYPASLTKIMTLYMVFEALENGALTMNSKLKVSRRAARMPPSKLGLRAGQTIKVKDAMLALMTKSANDVAVTVAEALGGTESNFARLMTRQARALGMSRTTFRNASGLPNGKQLSTARDMSKLARIVLRKFPKYYKYFSTRSFTYRGRAYNNHNKLLKSFLGTDGIKTGYTHASGFNLVASAVRDRRRLIGVVFGGKTGRSRDKHMKTLLTRAFAKAGKRGVTALVSAPRRKPRGTGGRPVTPVAEARTPSATPTPTPSAAASLAAASLAAARRVTIEAKAANGGTQAPAGGRPTANLPSLQALVATPAPKPAPRSGPESDPIGARIASLIGAPRYRDIPKRPAFDAPIAAPGEGVEPPAYAAIPTRPDYRSAQGSSDSPVPKPPRYGKIPRRPDLAARADRPATADAPATEVPRVAAGSLGSFKIHKPRQTAARHGTLWGVQVGAFRHLPLAELTASEVARAAPAQLGGMAIEISQAATGGGVYRARFTGANEDRARAVCKHLQARNISCVVVPPVSDEG